MTGYIIYYQQQDGGHNGSKMAGAAATTATITGLMTRATYSITMVATSSTLPSTVTAAVTIITGMLMILCERILHCGQAGVVETGNRHCVYVNND